MPRRLRSHTILGGPLRGMHIVTSWHDYPAAILGYTERGLTSWLLENVGEGETWLDVGAHYGYTSIAMCHRVGKGGRVFAFEPSLPTVACLERMRRENDFAQLSLLPFALADYPCMTLLYIETTRGMIDSLLPSERSEGLSQVLAIGLDALWEGAAPMEGPIHGVKIDVQGMEIEALKGMAGTLSRHRPKLVLEIHQGVPRDAVISVIGGCGYDTHPTPIEDDSDNFFDPNCFDVSFLFQS